MAKIYIGRSNSGEEARSTTTVGTPGGFQHLLVRGPTVGYFYGLSGDVNAQTMYVVENGPTLGIQFSAT